MTAPARRPWPWLALAVAFLALELPAAFSKRVRRYWVTLSETVPRWFPTKLRFVLGFGPLAIVLPIHLYGMVAMSLGEPGHWYWSAQAIAAAGAPLVLSIAYAELWERRSTVGIFSDVKMLLKLRSALGRLREAAKMGKLKATLWALGGAIGTSVALQFTGACPGIVQALPMLGMAFVGSVFAYLAARPLTKAGQKVAGMALFGGALVAGAAKVGEQLDIVCGPGFVDKIPATIFAGAYMGMLLWLRPDKPPKGDLGSVTPPALKG